ncbi:MAG: type III-B CRISPR module RAMP protein Cmr4 [Candidatus Aenigmatarchaeota archaeon]
MFNEKGLILFHCLTPIHMGAGQSVSYVDNVVQREKHTGFPTLWASGIKGVLRALCMRINNEIIKKEKVEEIFGPENDAEERASIISITDAKILFYPVRSVKGIFAYITCPFVIKKFFNELKILGIIQDNSKCELIQEQLIKDSKLGDDKVIVDKQSDIKIENNTVGLEEFSLSVEKEINLDNCEDFKKFINSNGLDFNFIKRHLAIVSDDVFSDFVKYSVEIRTRIRINQETGTVADKALFTEELIPAESIFYSFIFANKRNQQNGKQNKQQNEQQNERVLQKIEKVLKEVNGILQLGGDETLGKGIVKAILINGEVQKNGQSK